MSKDDLTSLKPAQLLTRRALLGWEPKEKGLIEDIDQPYYFKS